MWHNISVRCYQVDPNVPVEYRASNTDYLGSGWSRGHMAAAANHVRDQQEMNETFYLSNVVPQVLNNNIGYALHVCVCVTLCVTQLCMCGSLCVTVCTYTVEGIQLLKMPSS